jgi:TM2 domain-containing membrane protein YozV
MKGRIIDYSIQKNCGLISGTDGSRYTFVGSEWKADKTPVRGMAVDFAAQETSAVAVYMALPDADFIGTKNKTAAGLLAIFLGSFGIHKFYLGYTGPGLVFLLVNTIGWVVTIFFLGIPNIALGFIALIEGIIYLTKSDEEFEQTYIVDKRPWF